MEIFNSVDPVEPAADKGSDPISAETDFDVCSEPAGTDTMHPSMVCICSDDAVWADLLAQNLIARGVSTVRCTLRTLMQSIDSLEPCSWVIVDGGWPMLELEKSASDLSVAFREAGVSTVMMIDELVGGHMLAAFDSDTTISRTPDMRVLVRRLLSLFQAPSSGGKAPVH